VPARPTLTYTELADRIEAEIGIRPALSTLRAAATTSTRYGRRIDAITAGMPAPKPTRDSRRRAILDAAAIDAWLNSHPRKTIHHHQQQISTASLARRPTAVAEARCAGLSWQHIADACATADGRSYTKQWAQQRFGKA